MLWLTSKPLETIRWYKGHAWKRSDCRNIHQLKFTQSANLRTGVQGCLYTLKNVRYNVVSVMHSKYSPFRIDESPVSWEPSPFPSHSQADMENSYKIWFLLRFLVIHIEPEKDQAPRDADLDHFWPRSLWRVGVIACVCFHVYQNYRFWMVKTALTVLINLSCCWWWVCSVEPNFLTVCASKMCFPLALLLWFPGVGYFGLKPQPVTNKSPVQLYGFGSGCG